MQETFIKKKKKDALVPTVWLPCFLFPQRIDAWKQGDNSLWFSTRQEEGIMQQWKNVLQNKNSLIKVTLMSDGNRNSAPCWRKWNMEIQEPQFQPQPPSVTLCWWVPSSGCAHESQGEAVRNFPGGTGQGKCSGVILFMGRELQREIPAPGDLINPWQRPETDWISRTTIYLIRNCSETQAFCWETAFLQKKLLWTNFSILKQQKWSSLVYSSKAKADTLSASGVDVSDFSAIAAFATGNYCLKQQTLIYVMR